ncbi:MAG TPA: respiratory nitrate reductase subunit gamma [Polyangia bacterium]|jgi:nitrate reductase gamma subunit|nr:respiratory nitrate reductase subunit gamma [Polyangia bacterium]
MNTDTLFCAAPYAAVGAAALGFFIRFVARPRGGADLRPGLIGEGWRLLGGRRVWRIAFGVVLVGHLAVLVAPELIVRWNRSPHRLYLLEGIGVLLGALALVGLLAGMRRFLGGATRSLFREVADAVFLSSLTLSVFAGLAVAVRYRWASMWSVGTVVPYVQSLARAHPDPVLLTGAPMLAQLHILAALTAVAILPLTSLGTTMVLLAGRVVSVVTGLLDAGIAALARIVRLRQWAAWIWPEEDLLDDVVARRRNQAARWRTPRPHAAISDDAALPGMTGASDVAPADGGGDGDRQASSLHLGD